MAQRYDRPMPRSGGRQRTILALGVIALLALPVIAMRFTDEIDWTAFDFAAAALLLGGGAIGYDMATRRLSGVGARHFAGAGILALVALVWAQGAVGLF